MKEDLLRSNCIHRPMVTIRCKQTRNLNLSNLYYIWTCSQVSWKFQALTLFATSLTWCGSIMFPETSPEDRHENWNQPQNWSHLKHQGQQVPSLPTQLPAGAGLPSCTGDYMFGFCSLCMSSKFSEDFNVILFIFSMLGTLVDSMAH